MSQVTSENKILVNVAERLGIKEEPAVFQKGEQFLRVFQTKSTIRNVNDVAKTVLCFDLAASILGIGFDKETAIKLSGLKKSAYQNNLNIIEKVLELDKPLTIGEICVQYSCTVVKNLAEKIFAAYKEQVVLTDFSHPQYAVASVYTACKLKHFKVQKIQFMSIAHLKARQFKELEAEFDAFVAKAGITGDKDKKRGRKNKMHEYLEEVAQNNEMKVNKSPKKKVVVEQQEEDYDVWRKRILIEAKKALGIIS